MNKERDNSNDTYNGDFSGATSSLNKGEEEKKRSHRNIIPNAQVKKTGFFSSFLMDRYMAEE